MRERGEGDANQRDKGPNPRPDPVPKRRFFRHGAAPALPCELDSDRIDAIYSGRICLPIRPSQTHSIISKGGAMTRDLGEVFDAHTGAEFETRDIDATMATM